MKILIAGSRQAKKIHNYAEALGSLGLESVISLEETDVSKFAGLVLPGGGDVTPALYGAENTASRFPRRDIDEYQLAMAERFTGAGKPILGICKGLQILNVYFGGTLIQNLETDVAHRQDGCDAVHECRSVPGSDMERLYGASFPINSAHHQAVDRLGTGLVATSHAPDGVIESARHAQLPVIAVQWHPERMCFANARPDTVDGAILFRYFCSML